MSDPTRIDLRTDPTTQRMSGTALHGATPFDVPFISHIDGNLWQGGCQDGLRLPDFITHLVSLYPWETYDVGHHLASSLTVRMYDSEEQSFQQLDAIARWVKVCAEDGPTLVHCQAGLNRSGLVAARVLMLRGLTAKQAIEQLRFNRSPACLCNKAFERHLLTLDAP